MITNFKIFEKYNFESWYKIDDYVVAYKNRFMGKLGDYLADKVAPVVGIISDDLIDMKIDYYLKYDLVPEIMEYYDHTNGIISFNDKELRRATSEEIEQYKIEQKAKKYNL